MEVDILPWKLAELTSMEINSMEVWLACMEVGGVSKEEVNGNFLRSRLKETKGAEAPSWLGEFYISPATDFEIPI